MSQNFGGSAGGYQPVPRSLGETPRQAAFTTYFGAFILDPDGNKLEAVTFSKREASQAFQSSAENLAQKHI